MVPVQLFGVSSANGVVNSDASKAPPPRLVQAAHEFEGQMMKELLKPMTDGGSLTGAEGDDDEDPGSGGALGEFATESLGDALSAHGGFGIADRIVRDLSQSGDRRAGAKVTTDLHGNTLMRVSQ
jgi:Rod binding domain-containing protein